MLVRLVACSEFGAAVVAKNWQWFVNNVASFAQAKEEATTLPDLLAEAGDDLEKIKSVLRRIRNRTLLSILWRDLFGLAQLDETLARLSALADLMLDAATRTAERMLETRFGRVRAGVAELVPLVILGMGKLGGRELNFSSDIDLIFLYSEDGDSDGPRSISAQEYFGRLSRLIIALIDEITADGFVFRIDTRLRPFGESGPPVTSFAALESYLLKHGRDWERYAYIKARVVGPDPGAGIIAALGNDLIKPFVYRRYLDYGVFESLRDMHAMIAAEVKRRDLHDNVKLGPGGIREAEFIVQSLQLVRGGSDSQLQSSELQSVLPRLVNSRGLTAASARRLQTAYRYLRRVENFIQAIRDQQTHDLPKDAADRARLYLAMGYADWNALQHDIDKHRDDIADEFEQVAFRGQAEDTALHQQLARAWDNNASAEEWCHLLRQTGTAAVNDVAASLVAFAGATATRQIDSVAAERLRRFVPNLITEIMQTDDPLAALTRTISVVEKVLRRSAYLALLNENRGALVRLVDLCAQSRYIADRIARHPVLLDELLDPRVYSDAVTRSELSAELTERLGRIVANDSEAKMDSDRSVPAGHDVPYRNCRLQRHFADHESQR